MRAPTPAPVFRPQDHCEPHRAAPRKFRKHGSRTCRTPYQHSWDIPKNAVPAPDRGSGAPAAHRVQGLPAPLRQGAWPPQKPPEFWLFFPFYASQCHAPPCHCPDSRAYTRADTTWGWYVRTPTPAPVFRPQDHHCEPAGVLKCSLESMHLDVQSSYRPDSFNGIYQNRLF